MQSKLIIGLCLMALLMFGAVLAQTNTNNQQTNSNTNNQSNSNLNNYSNSNIANTANPKSEEDSPSEGEREPIYSHKPCRFFGLRDAEKVMGEPLQFRYEELKDEEIICVYNKLTNPNVSLEGTFHTYPNLNNAKDVTKLEREILELSQTLYPRDYTIKSVNGIGDEAWFLTGKKYNQMYVRTGNTTFDLYTYKGKKVTLLELKRVDRKIVLHLSAVK